MSDPRVQKALAALAEPTRFRIVELLGRNACSVSEVQAAIGALQPQTTKHIQALEAAGVIRVHRLGRRRVARLDRETMALLESHFAGLAAPSPDDAELAAYESAIRAEESLGERENRRPLVFERSLPASARDVWTAWTDPAVAARWWAPRHFEVEEFTLSPVAGSAVRLTLREAPGIRYTSTGRVLEAEAPGRLVFELAPVDEEGDALFLARHVLTLSGEETTALRLEIQVSGVRDGAAPAVAGLEPGWDQLLTALAAELS